MMLKLEFVQVIAGLILTFGAAGMVTELPPEASWTTWLFCAAIALIGLLSMFMGVAKKPHLTVA